MSADTPRQPPEQPLIHPTAVIDPRAQLHPTVEVGPYTVIGPQVQVGEGTRIGPHAVLKGPMRIGRRNQIFQFTSLGEISQDKTARPEHDTRVEIGDDNTIREFVTIQRGTLKQDGLTRLGNDNWIMAYVHIAHDCIIGDHTVLANMTTLAGHVTVEDHVVLGGATLIHQFCRIGQHAFSAGGAGITRDVPPFLVVQGNPAEPRGINIEGIRRRDFSADDIADIKRAYRAIFMSGLRTDELRAELADAAARSAHVRGMLAFVENSKRLVQKSRSED
ncbi:MAG: acyl-ACP--UDP-N-acetylglucosamine O-acyltransferase [Nevskia sp.]|nr:acyl-ACP--UDP-N-acetylglucosamine O-acyltransferase [Nevskia sp.]